jgi:hypothetical protein
MMVADRIEVVAFPSVSGIKVFLNPGMSCLGRFECFSCDVV